MGEQPRNHSGIDEQKVMEVLEIRIQQIQAEIASAKERGIPTDGPNGLDKALINAQENLKNHTATEIENVVDTLAA